MLVTLEQLSLSDNKVLKLVCTVVRTIKFYSWTIYFIEGIDWFKLINQEGNKSVNR